MKYILAIALLIFGIVFAQAQVPMTGAGLPKPAAAGGACTAPGDVVSGAIFWVGLRGYNAAYSTGSNPAVDLVDQAGANTTTINIKSDGTLDIAAISTWVTAHTVTTIKVTKLYDQTGNGHHIVQATLANMPTLVLGPVTGLAANRPAMTFATQFLQSAVTSLPVTSQPITFSSVAKRTSGSGTAGISAAGNGGDVELVFDSTNQAGVFAGGSVGAAAAVDNTWHALQGIFNGASSVINIDGSSTTVSTGTTGITAGVAGPIVGQDPFGNALAGNSVEWGGWGPPALSGPNMSSLSTSQHCYWGF